MNLVRLDKLIINLDHITHIEDHPAQLVVHLSGGTPPLSFSGDEATRLRTYLQQRGMQQLDTAPDLDLSPPQHSSSFPLRD